MVVDLGKTEILEREMPELLQRRLGSVNSRRDLLQNLTQPARRHHAEYG
jgi:hypothetical protein